MKQLSMYSDVVGDLPKMVAQGKPQLFIPYSEVLQLKQEILTVLKDKTHTNYQNECYLSFLFKRVGLPVDEH